MGGGSPGEVGMVSKSSKKDVGFAGVVVCFEVDRCRDVGRNESVNFRLRLGFREARPRSPESSRSS
jgi:hypothetical protein